MTVDPPCFEGRPVWMAAAAFCAGLALTACNKPDGAAQAPAPAASAASSAAVAASGAKASIFKPFDFEIAGAAPNIKDGTEVMVIPVYGGGGDDDAKASGALAERSLGSGTVSGGRLSIKGRSPLPQPVFLFAKGEEFALTALMLQEGKMEVAPGEAGELTLTNPRYGQPMAAAHSAEWAALRAEVDQAEAALADKGLKGKARAAAEKRSEQLSRDLFKLHNSEEVAFINNTAADPFERLLVLESNVDEDTLTPQRRLALLDEIEQRIGAHPIIDAKRGRLQQELREISAQKTVTVGAPFKEVIGVDLNGKEVRLSEVVKANKVVLLDIWASWCGICREEFPHLKKVYAKYRGQGFEVFAISTDERRKDWVEAMKQDKTTDAWLQIHDGRGQDANVAMDYGVNAYPAKFLITQDGKIAADSHSSKMDLDKLLPKLLK